MKRLLPLFILALFIFQLPPVSQAASQPPQQSKEFKKTVDFEAGGNLAIRTDKGSLRMTSWNQNQVEIVARIAPPEDVDADYGRRAVEAARIEVLGDARSLTIRSNFDDVPYRDFLNRSRNLPNIHYEIRAPRSLKLDLEVDRCEIEVSGFEGSTRMNADRTPVKASDLSGGIHLQIDRGEATLSRIRGSLDVEADRTNVDLQAVQIEGDSRFQIDRGELNLRMPESQGLLVQTDISRRGHFHSDFGITMQTARGKNFEGTINGGGPRLFVRTDRGRIYLKRQ